MHLPLNIRHLERGEIRFQGELTPEQLECGDVDELVKLELPLKFDFVAATFEGGVLLRGKLEIRLNCECARCLRSFESVVGLAGWGRLLPLDGEERVTVRNDCVDLTPYLREDIVLAFPQHPLCNPDCTGLSRVPSSQANSLPAVEKGGAKSDPSTWAALDKLKLKDLN